MNILFSFLLTKIIILAKTKLCVSETVLYKCTSALILYSHLLNWLSIVARWPEYAQPPTSFTLSMSSCECTKSTQHLPDVSLNRPSSPLSMLHQTLRRPLATCDISFHPPPHTETHKSLPTLAIHE